MNAELNVNRLFPMWFKEREELGLDVASYSEFHAVRMICVCFLIVQFCKMYAREIQ